MSGSVGYDYYYVDLEAQRRRQLRSEVAELRQQLRDLRSQAARLQRSGRRAADRPTVVDSGLDGTSQQLDDVAATLRAEIASIKDEVDHALTAFWEDRVGAAFASDPSTRADTSTAAEELTRHRAAETATTPPATAMRLRAAEQASAVAQAEGLLAADGHRCDPADLELLQRLLRELRTLDRPAAVQQQNFEIRTVVSESISRRQRQRKVAAVQARLLTLIEEALPEDRERLRAQITAAPDPSGLTGQVAEAIGRADKVRNREAVAQATAEALAEIGCEVGEDFATLLAEQGETVAAFDQVWPGYGLLVRLPKEQSKVVAAVVRRDDVTGGRERDIEVQQGFCDGPLEKVANQLRKRIGASPTPFLRLAPGQRPVATVPAVRWPTARPAPAATDDVDQRAEAARPQAAPRAKERQRER